MAYASSDSSRLSSSSPVLQSGRRYASRIPLGRTETLLVDSFTRFPHAEQSYLTALYRNTPSAYCLTLVQDLQVGTLMIETAFNELKVRSKETLAVAHHEFTPLRDEATTDHLVYLYQYRNNLAWYTDLVEDFERTCYQPFYTH